MRDPNELRWPSRQNRHVAEFRAVSDLSGGCCVRGVRAAACRHCTLNLLSLSVRVGAGRALASGE